MALSACYVRWFDIVFGVEGLKVDVALSDRFDVDLIVDFVRVALPDSGAKVRLCLALNEQPLWDRFGVDTA